MNYLRTFLKIVSGGPDNSEQQQWASFQGRHKLAETPCMVTFYSNEIVNAS